MAPLAASRFEHSDIDEVCRDELPRLDALYLNAALEAASALRTQEGADHAQPRVAGTKTKLGQLIGRGVEGAPTLDGWISMVNAPLVNSEWRKSTHQGSPTMRPHTSLGDPQYRPARPRAAAPLGGRLCTSPLLGHPLRRAPPDASQAEPLVSMPVSVSAEYSARLHPALQARTPSSTRGRELSPLPPSTSRREEPTSPEVSPRRQPNLSTLSKEGKASSRLSPGAPFGGKSRSLLVPQEGKKHKRSSPLWKLHLPSNTPDRMHRLNAMRRARFCTEVLNRDKVTKGASMELAEECLLRYFGHESPFIEKLVIEALADFGLFARTRPEKLVLKTVLAMYEGCRLSLDVFCDIIEECRIHFRDARSKGLFLTFKSVDVLGRGAVSYRGALDLLQVLDVAPSTPSETLLVNSAIGELKQDEDGLLPFTEVLHLVQTVTEYVHSTRRRSERELQSKYNLKVQLFDQFRSQLLELYASFTDLDADGSGVLEENEVRMLLWDYGFITQQGNKGGVTICRHTLAQLVEGSKKINFPRFLVLLMTLREAEMAKRAPQVHALFTRSDSDGSEELDMKETLSILAILGLEPRTPKEQLSIARLMDEVDKDGSGQLGEEELGVMVQRISERLHQLQHAEETRYATEVLKLSKSDANVLRDAFESIDMDHSGCLTFDEVKRAVQMVKWRVSEQKLRDLMLQVDVDGSGELEFVEFLTLMSRVDDDLRQQGGPTATAAEKMPREPAQDQGADNREAVERASSHGGAPYSDPLAMSTTGRRRLAAFRGSLR